ncbi:MAG: hypoxanthine phosphoribosyltransferase [Candidatus Rokuibacteriota bacterium]
MGHRLGRVLIPTPEIARRVRELGLSLSRDYEGKNPLLVGVLKGAAVFMADLVRAADIPLAADFVAVGSYWGATRSSGVVKITADLSVSLEDRHVVLVDDIIDTGRTISYLKQNLQARRPASLKVMALLDKRERREVEVELDYVGFTIPNEFVVGYGLDYRGFYRDLPYIAALEEDPGG